MLNNDSKNTAITTTAQNDREAQEDTMKTFENIDQILEFIENEPIICQHCGCVIEEGHDHEVDGEHYCDDCFERLFVECNECGEIIRRSDAYEGADGELYCERCFYDHFCYCEHCGAVIDIDDAFYDERREEFFCEDCRDRLYTQCDHCGEWMRDGRDISYEVHTDENDYDRTETWCENCTYNTFVCDQCGDIWMCGCDYGGSSEYLCPACAEERENGHQDTDNIDTWQSPKRRMSYGFKPVPCMCATDEERSAAGEDWKRKIVFYGFELEIDRRNDNRDQDETSSDIVDILPNTYCKEDGSLNLAGSHSGIEIVSHPATLAYHEQMSSRYEEAFKMLMDDGWLSHNAGTCGLHVHISLHALEDANPYAVHNMLILVDRFWDNLVKFSRRTESQLNSWARRYATRHKDYERIKDMAKHDCNRYMAVNLQNSHTVELRIFRGTLNIETFMATLQLVDVLVKRCIEIGHDYQRLQNITWNELVESDHADLNSYLDRRGLRDDATNSDDPGSVDDEEPGTFPCGIHVGARVAVHGERSLPEGMVAYGYARYQDANLMAVEMDDTFAQNLITHECHAFGNAVTNSNGYWVHVDDCVEMPEVNGFNVGDMVRYIGHSKFDPAYGTIGIVVSTRFDPEDYPGVVAVRWPQDFMGHSGDVSRHGYRNCYSIWNVTTNDIEHV